jgi:CheY-like chemotaxis protein
VRRGAVLTNQLLAFGRKHVVRPERLDLSTVVRHYEELFGTSFPPGVRIEQDLAAGAFVLADRTEIEQILHALCVNASLAMPQGGRLTLRTRLDTGSDNALCIIEVEDEGAGMDEATQSRLFEPFFSTRVNGAGLGLATTRAIVERYGGTVSVRSTKGAGTLVRVSLPRLKTSLAKPTGRASVPGGGRTVLVVDDEPLVRRTLVRPLERAEFTVREAEDGLAALQVLREDSSVCVVVSDVLMPGMDGITLARHVQERNIPVILVSGYADMVSNDNQLGVPMLAKPFSAKELVALVRREAARNTLPELPVAVAS